MSLSSLIRGFIRLFTSDKQAQRQREYLKQWHSLTWQFDEIVQREIFLLEQRVKLRDFIHDEGPSDERNERVCMIDDELKEMKPRLFENAQQFAELRSQNPGGILVKQYARLSELERWRLHQKECSDRLGCCARRCGCCETPRRCPANQRRRMSVERTGPSHCTVECGCCKRWRAIQGPDTDDLVEVREGA
ncbi:hypothetical protein MW887_010786 [Aspergillus wentii]|nr:hypothetical protein MW887_010786 [Aspergillus wentii]